LCKPVGVIMAAKFIKLLFNLGLVRGKSYRQAI